MTAVGVRTAWITVRSDRPLWWQWQLEHDDNGHALTRAGAFRAGRRALRRIERKAARDERRRARTVRTRESQSVARGVR